MTFGNVSKFFARMYHCSFQENRGSSGSTEIGSFSLFLKIHPIRCWSCDLQCLVSKHAFLPGVGHVNCCGVPSHAFCQV
jgi:hypothetical protein